VPLQFALSLVGAKARWHRSERTVDTIPIATISVELLHFVSVAKAIYQFCLKLPTEAKRLTIAGIL
jgi:hypothetical protein